MRAKSPPNIRRGQTIGAFALGIVGIAALCYWQASPLRVEIDPGVETSRSSIAAIPGASARNSYATPQVTSKISVNEAGDSQYYASTFNGNTDYWKWAHESLLPAARAGNVDAQFFLAKVLDRCAGDNSVYFLRKNRLLSLDEAKQVAVAMGHSADRAQTVYDRCHPFLGADTSDLGDAATWLAAATDGRQPAAEATTAARLLEEDGLRQIASAAHVEPNIDKPTSNSLSPRELMREAAASRDPEALFVMADALALLSPAETIAEENLNSRAWMLLACEAGYACGPKTDWAKSLCRGDEAAECAAASGPTDVIRVLSGDQWAQVQQRARQIGAALDAKSWIELGLGS